MESFRELLENRYKVALTDKEYSDLEYVMSTHNFTPVNSSFEAYNDIDSLINNIHLLKKIHLSRSSTEIMLEEVIFSLYPIPFGETVEIKTMLPSMTHKKVERAVKPIVLDKDKNITIIRSISFDTKTKPYTYDEHFTFMLYSKKLNIQAGIIFEPI